MPDSVSTQIRTLREENARLQRLTTELQDDYERVARALEQRDNEVERLQHEVAQTAAMAYVKELAAHIRQLPTLTIELCSECGDPGCEAPENPVRVRVLPVEWVCGAVGDSPRTGSKYDQSGRVSPRAHRFKEADQWSS